MPEARRAAAERGHLVVERSPVGGVVEIEGLALRWSIDKGGVDWEANLLAAYQLGGKEMGAAQFLLGQVYFQKEDFEKAMRAFELYLIDVPQAPNRAEVQGVIEKIRLAIKK